MFTKVLVANRGEIACRILRTLKRLNIQSVAVYSEADKQSLHVKHADEAYAIGPSKASESYLNQEVIIQTALKAGANAIHPGYGFLSENADFVEACLSAGLIFIGPTVSSMRIMASKQRSKQLLESSNVPLIPGYHGSIQSDTHLFTEAERIGFPLMIKAALGGGGKGMRVVSCSDEFHHALQSARREALAFCGDEAVILEKLMINPRHIEIQIMADNHGHVVHLFDRDCSIQRRHQKIIEEAPASNLPSILREALCNAAIRVATAIHYQGAGTVEFLVENNQTFYFMEMNTRLQVEHPVTEMITCLDLVEWQLRIAANESLPCSQEHIQITGHAIECRVCAEDSMQQFMPSTGQLIVFSEPQGIGVRLDNGVAHQDTIHAYYDPLLSKLITWGNTRQEAILRMQGAIAAYRLAGIKTNLRFLQAIIAHPHFLNGPITTEFLIETSIKPDAPDIQEALFFAAAKDYLNQVKQVSCDDVFAWHLNLTRQWSLRYAIQGAVHLVTIYPQSKDIFCLEWQEQRHTLHIMNEKLSLEPVEINHSPTLLSLGFNSQCVERYITSIHHNQSYVVYTSSGPCTLVKNSKTTLTTSTQALDTECRAPMSAIIIAELKKPGDVVRAGEELLILEAMKMEHTLSVAVDCKLIAFSFPIGTQIHEGVILAQLEPWAPNVNDN